MISALITFVVVVFLFVVALTFKLGLDGRVWFVDKRHSYSDDLLQMGLGDREPYWHLRKVHILFRQWSGSTKECCWPVEPLASEKIHRIDDLRRGWNLTYDIGNMSIACSTCLRIKTVHSRGDFLYRYSHDCIMEVALLAGIIACFVGVQFLFTLCHRRRSTLH